MHFRCADDDFDDYEFGAELANEHENHPIPSCSRCGKQLPDETFLADEEDFCETCCNAYLLEIEAEARDFALVECELTGKPEVFDAEYEHRCTPEQYESGSKESYTENSVCAFNRHRCTNYDECIEGLDKWNRADRVRYAVVRARCSALVRVALEASSKSEGVATAPPRRVAPT